MFDKLILEISDIHGRLEEELGSAYFDAFTAGKKAMHETTLKELHTLRLRLNQIHQALGDPLWVVLLGRFSSGKSTLINAFFKGSGCGKMRETGLFPTDRQATAVLHESCRTGLLASNSSVVQVEGLGLLVQEHKDDRLRPLLLMDTPGLLDDKVIDDALMEFVAHADVVLHCMTGDATFLIPDCRLLEKRRKHFPSQVYNVVVTKADLHYKDESGHYSEELWLTNRVQLDARYAKETRENLDHSANAKTRRAWVVDSISGLHVEDLLSFLLKLAVDQEEDIPRVRVPIARERFSYVCSVTREKVIAPILECLEDSRASISDARQRLTEGLEHYRHNVLAPTREVLLLGIQSLRKASRINNINDSQFGTIV
ncbi:MAG: GTPase [Planctomycetota bacterium]